MSSLDLDNSFIKIIEKKYQELNLGRDYTTKFSKIRDFEANAIGQIGEEFIKAVVSNITEIKDGGVIHDEYDLVTKSGVYFEIKTARQGRRNNTFQFNGINPDYNYDHLICLGVCEDRLLYRFFLKSEIEYDHSNGRKFYVKQGDYKSQLVQMNPNNLVNFKLTINEKDLYNISTLIDDLTRILKPNKSNR